MQKNLNFFIFKVLFEIDFKKAGACAKTPCPFVVGFKKCITSVLKYKLLKKS
jgi:hypothetical protein